MPRAACAGSAWNSDCSSLCLAPGSGRPARADSWLSSWPAWVEALQVRAPPGRRQRPEQEQKRVRGRCQRQMGFDAAALQTLAWGNVGLNERHRMACGGCQKLKGQWQRELCVQGRRRQSRFQNKLRLTIYRMLSPVD